MKQKYDLSYLKRVTKGREEPLYRIIHLFTKDAPFLLNQAIDYLHAGKYAELQKVFHKMKNSVSLFMAKELENKIKYVEQLCQEMQPSREKISLVFLEIRTALLRMVYDLSRKSTHKEVNI